MAGKKMEFPTEAGEPRTEMNLIKRGGVPVARRMEVFRDDWRNEDRVYRWYGKCITCGRNCYAFDDGGDDPRGPLGDNALWVIHPEDGDESVCLRTCAMCANEYEAYKRAQEKYKVFFKSYPNNLAELFPIVWPR